MPTIRKYRNIMQSRVAVPHVRYLCFTMIELMLVISIIVILAGLLLPSLKKAHEVAKRIKCVGNERQLHLAWSNYCTDYNGFLPVWSTSLWGDTGTNNKPWTVTMAESLKPVMVLRSWGAYMIDWRSFLSCPNLPLPDSVAASYGVYQDQHYPAFGMNHMGIGGDVVNGCKLYTNASHISQPSRLVAFCDNNLASSGAPQYGYYGRWCNLNITDLRHLLKNNILFCDGHVEPKDRYFFNPPWGWWNLAPWGNP